MTALTRKVVSIVKQKNLRYSMEHPYQLQAVLQGIYVKDCIVRLMCVFFSKSRDSYDLKS